MRNGQAKKQMSQKIGLKPGSLLYVGPERTDKVSVTIFDYTDTELTERVAETVQDCFGYQDMKTMTWIQVSGLHEVDVIRELGEYFELHPLILEDILNTQLRPKFEDAGEYLYFSLKRLEIPEEHGVLVGDQVGVVWGPRYVISFTERSTGILEPVRERIRKTIPRVRFMNSDYLAYAIVDTIVDHYFVTLERMGERIDSLDDGLIDNPEPEQLEDIHELKRELVDMRRAIWPVREAINMLERSESKLIHDDTRPYIRDLYEHAIQIRDTIDTYRDMVSGLTDLYMTSVSNKMNNVMKVLTIIATIFIPLSFLAGVYGMNFDTSVSAWNLPELGMKYGYPIFWALVLLIGGGLLVFFRRKKWL